ncbi:MarR family winged helix-turn-helix transcriptional regulator [Streptomyces sp. NPDC059008]|uniref:MarR family winged helix-turn-helix transcriptional regulator n=1 Tax=Streptomyces sp. NPDC059008 TaxID=3346693 RepID=UPI0036996BF4
MSHAPDELTRQIVGLFAAINRRYSQESEAAATAHGLTPLQAKALLAAEEPAPMRHIADRLHAEPSNVTTIVDRLESRGLAERSPDPDDRRVKRVAATEAGRTVAVDLRTRMPFAAAPLARLTAQQRETLRELLQLVLDT